MRFSHLCKSGVKYARAINMKGVGWAKEGTVGWRYHKRVSCRLPLLIHFNCCSNCTAGYDILLYKTILKLIWCLR